MTRLRSFADAGQNPGLWPSAIARLYGIPLDQDGAGQAVGVIAVGGGYLPTDMAVAATAANRPVAHVIEVPVDGVTNNFGGGTRADAELALDLQVLAALVPAAQIIVYFSPDSQEGLARAIQQAVTDEINRPSVLSISWGSAEKYWMDLPGDGQDSSRVSARDQVQAALQAARDRKVTVVAASGDELATAGETDGAAHVIFPGSSPLVLSCGGTDPAFSADRSAIENEKVWNDGSVGTGGGISDIFPVPDYQQKTILPPSFNDGSRRRRGMPDVAAAASPNPGYQIMLHGKPVSMDGTSAATPLWAALVVLANAMRGQPLGLINPYLYANPWVCRRIVCGNNRIDGIGYDASPDWNACTGLGVPVGKDIISALAAMV
jgi:kumamolisin